MPTVFPKKGSDRTSDPLPDPEDLIRRFSEEEKMHIPHHFTSANVVLETEPTYQHQKEDFLDRLLMVDEGAANTPMDDLLGEDDNPFEFVDADDALF